MVDNNLVKDADFSWEAFPPPPPEAENWNPDPDSVARPGDLPGQRLTRDPSEDAMIAALKKGTGMYNRPADVAVGMKSGSLSPAVKAATSASPGRPAWAAPLEKALDEEPQKAPGQVSKAPAKSIPPHLRKFTKSTVGTPGPRLDPAAKTYEPHIGYHDMTPRRLLTMSAAEAIVSEEKKISDEALAWEMATTELGVDSPEQVGSNRSNMHLHLLRCLGTKAAREDAERVHWKACPSARATCAHDN